MDDILTPEGLVKDFTSDPAPMNTVERLLDNMSGGKNVATATNNLEKILAEKISGQDLTTPTNGLEEELKKVKTGGGTSPSLPRKNINFHDFEGRIIHAFTLEEVQSLSELPALPAMAADKIALGWDKTLNEVKDLAIAGGDATVEVVTADKDVLFIDYDGTVLYGYTMDEFAELTMLPEVPTYDDKISQGWNWSLTDAKAIVSDGGKLVIGATYVPKDGMTHVHFFVPEDRLTINLRLAVQGSIEVDWGDGSEAETITGTSKTTAIMVPHTYTYAGEKHLAFGGTGQTYIIGADNTSTYDNQGSILSTHIHRDSITAIEIGSNCTISGSFSNMHNLKTVTIPQGITTTGESAFNECYSLLAIILPIGFITIRKMAFYLCQNAKYVSIPKSVTTIGESAFYGVSKIKTVCIPSNVSTWSQYSFRGCFELERVYIESGVTMIGANAFHSCHKLKDVDIPIGITTVGGSAFVYCFNIPRIELPDTVTVINQGAFDYCESLRRVTLGSITMLDQTVLRMCTGLTELTIPSTVTEIRQPSGSLFSLKKLRFEPETPPTIGSSYRYSFSNLPTDCIIEVKYSEDHHILDAYKSAQYYPSPDTYTYVEYTDE